MRLADRITARDTDHALLWVQGGTTRYRADSIATVEQHLRGIATMLANPDITQRRHDELRADRDKLLDRLAFLLAMDGEGTEPC